MLASELVDNDDAECIGLIESLWTTVLAPAYVATRKRRLAPNAVEDYFVRAGERLTAASEAGLLPPGDAPLVVRNGTSPLIVKRGWSDVLARASERLSAVAPPFGTFVHGDPNPENVLVRRHGDGRLEFRLIDPKDWWTGDYLFDVAKLGHYIMVTSPVEHHRVMAEISIAKSATISYDAAALGRQRLVEAALLACVEKFACDEVLPDCDAWRTRYALAVAANLLGIVGPRLERAESENQPRHRHLALVALGEGLHAVERALA